MYGINEKKEIENRFGGSNEETYTESEIKNLYVSCIQDESGILAIDKGLDIVYFKKNHFEEYTIDESFAEYNQAFAMFLTDKLETTKHGLSEFDGGFLIGSFLIREEEIIRTFWNAECYCNDEEEATKTQCKAIYKQVLASIEYHK